MRAAALFGFLALAKILSLAGRDVPLSPLAPLAYLWDDALVALAFGALDAALRRPRWMWGLYGAIGLYAAVNVPVARVLSSPLTWTMARAARGTISDSILHYATPLYAAMIAAVIGAAIGIPFLTRRIPANARRALAAAGLVVVVAGALSASSIDTRGAHRNAIVALVATALPRVEARAGDEDWRASEAGGPVEDLAGLRGRAKGFNVVLVALESAGARYLRPYGAAEDPMPNLTRLASRGIVFENAYAVYPESVKGLLPVFCSVTPAFDTAPEAYRSLRVPSLAQTLAATGYRTALFHSGRFDYLGMRSLVSDRGFDTLEDAGAIGGVRESSFGVDEASAVRRLTAWIDGLGRGERFLAAYLPIAGHHPYANSGGPFPEDGGIGSYRNALHEADAALGELLRGLEARGLAEETLLVVYGDHGEAFGQHEGNHGHTLFIHEENVRVPLIVAVPGESGRVRRVASLLDIAPTVVDLLGLGAPPGWQGSSLLEGPPRAALFFTDYALGWLGARDGRWKVIHELDGDRSQLFDLEEDPGESHDLAPLHPALVRAWRDRLRGWCAAEKHRVSNPAGGQKR